MHRQKKEAFRFRLFSEKQSEIVKNSFIFPYGTNMGDFFRRILSLTTEGPRWIANSESDCIRTFFRLQSTGNKLSYQAWPSSETATTNKRPNQGIDTLRSKFVDRLRRLFDQWPQMSNVICLVCDGVTIESLSRWGKIRKKRPFIFPDGIVNHSQICLDLEWRDASKLRWFTDRSITVLWRLLTDLNFKDGCDDIFCDGRGHGALKKSRTLV